MKKKNKVIQGCRAIAMLMIFFAHTATFLKPGVTWFSGLGEQGVYIFIVISGMLLYRNSLSKEYGGSLKDGFCYAKTKVKSLYWLHVIMWAVMFLLTVSKFNLKRSVVYSIFNLSLTQSFIPFSGIINSFNGPSWYLSMCVFLWLLTSPFMKWYEGHEENNSKSILSRNLIIVLSLIWIIWLNAGNVIIWGVDQYMPMINSDWFARWLLYSCPVLDFLIYVLAFCESRVLCVGEKYSKSNTAIAVLVVVASFVSKGNIPVVYNVPFALAVIYLVNYFIDNSENWFSKLLSSDAIVFFGNLSAYFFLIHGPVNYIINRTKLAEKTPLAFLVAFLISSVASAVFYSAYKKYR